MCSKLTIKHQKDVNDVALVFLLLGLSIIISHLFLLFLLFTLNKQRVTYQERFGLGMSLNCFICCYFLYLFAICLILLIALFISIYLLFVANVNLSNRYA